MWSCIVRLYPKSINKGYNRDKVAMFHRLSLPIQTIISELIGQVRYLESTRKLGSQRGAITKKKIKETYQYYYRFYDYTGKRKECYIGSDTAETQAFIQNFLMGVKQHIEEQKKISELTKMVAAGGVVMIDRSTFSIIEALANQGIFRSGGVPAFGVYAHPVRYLDYLIEGAIEATVASSSKSAFVVVPDPSRFALHKLIVASKRSVVDTTKIDKDTKQASILFEYLLEDRPDDLDLAFENLKNRGKGWVKNLENGIKKMQREKPEIAKQIRQVLIGI